MGGFSSCSHSIAWLFYGADIAPRLSTSSSWLPGVALLGELSIRKGTAMRKEDRLRKCGFLLLWVLASATVGCAGSSDSSAESKVDQPKDSTAKTAPLDAESTSEAVATDVESGSADPALVLPDKAADRTAPRGERAVESIGPELAPPTGDMQTNKRDDGMPKIARSMMQPRSFDMMPPLDSRPDEPTASDPDPGTTADTGPAAPQDTGPEPAINSVEGASSFELVKVFYATDRQAEDPAISGVFGALDVLPPATGIVVTMILLGLGIFRRGRRLFWSLAVMTSFVTVAWAGIWFYGQWTRVNQSPQKGVRYGNERGSLQLGNCLVSIPKSHEIGKVESPSILRLEVREDVRKHIVLQRTEPEAESVFYQQLRQRVQQSDKAEVFVFVHGYNVTFDAAARRTAQIAYDVKFAGAPIFFSWPSQGGLLQYTVDETNVAWTVPHLKQFLLDVVEKSGAKSVNLIAHSMGSRALTQALRELELELKEQSALFNQVILAAPDIDAEIFRRDLAPALVRASQHVTLYASSNDQALAASKKVHGYLRAGESGNGLVVTNGVDTIDVSLIDTSILGHSYYGSSNPILRDIYFLIHDALPAARRRWLRPASSYDGLTYWVFQQAQRTARRAVD